MKQSVPSVSIACALAAVPVAASAAGDPLAQPKADLAKLTADAGRQDAVAADVTHGDVAKLEA